MLGFDILFFSFPYSIFFLPKECICNEKSREEMKNVFFSYSIFAFLESVIVMKNREEMTNTSTLITDNTQHTRV